MWLESRLYKEKSLDLLECQQQRNRSHKSQMLQATKRDNVYLPNVSRTGMTGMSMIKPLNFI